MAEFDRVNGIENGKAIERKLALSRSKTAVALRALVQDNYRDLIACFVQSHQFEHFFTAKNCNLGKMLQSFATVLRFQDELEFDLAVRECAVVGDGELLADDHLLEIPGNDLVDSPSQIIDDLHAMCDERKWSEAISILNMITQDIYRGEYEYLRASTRKRIKLQIKRSRKFIYYELATLLLRNALSKLYRHRLTVYILKIQKCRYFNRGIRLYLRCKAKEFDHELAALKNAVRGEAKHYVTDLAVLALSWIRELLQEFNNLLIESRNVQHHDAYSYLTVFVMDTVVRRFVEQFESQVFEAAKCGVSFQVIGECLRIALGYFDKLKWHGLSLGTQVMTLLFSVVVDSLDIYFKDRVTETRYAVLHELWTSRQLKLSPLHRPGDGLSTPSKNASLSLVMSPWRNRRSRRKQRLSRRDSVVVEGTKCFAPKNRAAAVRKKIVWLTPSAQSVYDSISKSLYESRALLSSLHCPVMASNLSNVFVDRITKYIQGYCSNATQTLRQHHRHRLSNEQCVAVTANVFWIATDLLHRIKNTVISKQRRPCRRTTVRIEAFQQKLAVLYKEHFRYFAKMLAVQCTDAMILGLTDNDNDCEDGGGAETNTLSLSEPMRSAMTDIVTVRDLYRLRLNRDAAKMVIGGAANAVIKQLAAGEFLERRMSRRGLRHFVFDLAFFGAATRGLLEDDAVRILDGNQIADEAVRRHQTEDPSTGNDRHFTVGTKQQITEAIRDEMRLNPQFDLNPKDDDEVDTTTDDDNERDDGAKVTATAEIE